MRQLIYILTIIFLSSCERYDDFYTVTKSIDIQDTIIVNEPFAFRLILRNDSLNEMKFTIDDTVQKSVSLYLDFRCNDDYIKSEVENLKSRQHNYHKYYLKKGDSLTYQFSGLLKQVNNKLQMEINGYETTYIIENIPCNYLTIDLSGMWFPGDPVPLDSMEGYGFRKKIFVKLDPTKSNK